MRRKRCGQSIPPRTCAPGVSRHVRIVYDCIRQELHIENVRAAEHAGISRLAAALREKHRLIEHDGVALPIRVTARTGSREKSRRWLSRSYNFLVMVKSPISHTSITGFFVALNPCLFVSNIVSLSHQQKKGDIMNQKLRNLVYTAMLIALCCVATLVIKIPTVTGGYLNAGDIVVVLAALLAGPLYGGVAAGFGSGLADVISGYMSYAPGTLVVKGCAAVVAALIFRACRKKTSASRC